MSDIIKGSEINSAGYGIIPKLAMQDLDLDIGAKAVYAYFCSFAGAGDICFPSREKICNDLRVSKNTLTKYITQLVKRGYLDVEQSKGNGRFANNVYTLRSEIEPCTKKQDTVQPDTKKPCTKISDTENLGYENLTPNNNSNKNNSSLKNNNLKNTGPTVPRSRFVKPTLEEIKAYCIERGNKVDPERFHAYYESNGWKVGKNPMKDWRAAVRNWERNSYATSKKPNTGANWDDLDGIL